MSIYDYKELKERALSPSATQEDINALGEWFERYGDRYWNGEVYDIENGISIRPISAPYEIDDDGEAISWETVGYELNR